MLFLLAQAGVIGVIRAFIKPNIRLQLIGFTLLIIVLVSGAISLYSIYDGRQRVLATFEYEASKVTAVLADALINDLYFLDVHAARSTLRSIRTNEDIVFTYVTDTEGRVLSDGTDVNPLWDQELKDPALSQVIASSNWLTRLDGDIYKRAGPIVMSDGSPIGYILVGFSLTHASRIVRDVTIGGLMIAMLCVGIGVLFAIVLATRISRPIAELVETSKTIGEGKLDARAPVNRYDELGTLAEAINQMAVDLSVVTVSQQYVDNIIHSMIDMLVVISHKGLIERVNDATLSILGYCEAELVGKPAYMIFPDGSSGGHWLTGYLSSVKSAQRFDTEWRTKNGRHIPVYLSVAPMCDAQGVFRGIVCAAEDITKRKQVEAELERTQQDYLELVNTLDSIVWEADAATLQFHFVSKQAEQILGYPVERWMENPDFWANHIHPDDRDSVVEYCKRATAEKRDHNLEYRMINASGETVWLKDIVSVVVQGNQPVKLRGVMIDITEAHALSDQLSYHASHDVLTGLANRREFEHQLNGLLASARHHSEQHALLYLDLDQFKVVNDSCGHAAGDQLLRQITGLLKTRVRDTDILARLGGDEFGVLLYQCPMEEELRVAEELLNTVRDFRFAWQQKIFTIGMSIGLVHITAESESVSSLLSAADDACYAAKEKGRNRIQVFRPDDDELLRRRGETEWVSRITKAVAEDNLELYAQRIAPVLPGVGDGNHWEILLRMTDKKRGLVPPGSFLPAAERYNLMPLIDRWVICALFARLASRADTRCYQFSINLSGQSVCDESFLAFVRDQFRESEIRPQQICFEITETAAIANLSVAGHFISVMKGMGCLFALDDFGSGLCSFTYLKNLPVDYLKIDGSFVKDMVEDPIDFAMVASINEIGHRMNIQTIAEFVEDEAIHEKLRELGVDYMQGYGIEKPRPLDEVLAEQRVTPYATTTASIPESG